MARAVLGELRAVRDATAAGGWTGDLVARALGALRIAAALAVGRPVAQQESGPAAGTPADPEGRLPVRSGLFGREMVLVSSALTERDVDRELARLRTESPEAATAVEALRAGLAGFAGVRYGTAADVPADELAADVEAGIGVLQSLQVELFEPIRRWNRLRGGWREWAANRWRP